MPRHAREVATLTPGPKLTASVDRIRAQIAADRQRIRAKVQPEIDRYWAELEARQAIDTAERNAIVEVNRERRAREATVLAERVARGEQEDVMATATKTKARATGNNGLSSDELARKAKVRNRAWKRAKAQGPREKAAFVKAWDAGEIDWRKLEKQYAAEDANKGKTTAKVTKPATPKRNVHAERPNSAAGRARAGKGGHPKAGASAEPRKSTSKPTTEASSDGPQALKSLLPKVPYTKEMQVGKGKAKTGGNRQAIQKRMAADNGQPATTQPEPEPVTAGEEGTADDGKE